MIKIYIHYGQSNQFNLNFIGSAWTYDEASDEYYLHLFCPEQPDLNWENPDVRAAVHGIINFWLSRGIDGFRMDVINYISKPPGLPDGDPSFPGWTGSDLYSAGPRLHEYLRDIGEILQKYNAFSSVRCRALWIQRKSSRLLAGTGENLI